MPRTNVDPTGIPLNPISIPVSGVSQQVPLMRETKRVSIEAVGGAIRFQLKTAVALSVSAEEGHYIGEGQCKDYAVPGGEVKLAVIRATGSAATSVEVTELS